MASALSQPLLTAPPSPTAAAPSPSQPLLTAPPSPTAAAPSPSQPLLTAPPPPTAAAPSPSPTPVGPATILPPPPLDPTALEHPVDIHSLRPLVTSVDRLMKAEVDYFMLIDDAMVLEEQSRKIYLALSIIVSFLVLVNGATHAFKEFPGGILVTLLLKVSFFIGVAIAFLKARLELQMLTPERDHLMALRKVLVGEAKALRQCEETRMARFDAPGEDHIKKNEVIDIFLAAESLVRRCRDIENSKILSSIETSCDFMIWHALSSGAVHVIVVVIAIASTYWYSMKMGLTWQWQNPNPMPT